VWDADEGGDVRVISSVDDGRWRAFLPLISSILKGSALLPCPDR